MPRLDVATTSQAVPLFSKARFLGKANRAIGISWWRVSPPPINSLEEAIGSGRIEGSPVLSPASLFLSGFLILPRGTLGGW